MFHRPVTSALLSVSLTLSLSFETSNGLSLLLKRLKMDSISTNLAHDDADAPAPAPTTSKFTPVTFKFLWDFEFDEGRPGESSSFRKRLNNKIPVQGPALNNVIDDREGLPITLSILFLELGRRIHISGLSGFPLPYHFLVKHETSDGGYRLIDVFNSGESMTYTEANEFVSKYDKVPFRSELLDSSSKKEIINRMLRNLLSFTQAENSLASSLPYLDLLIALNPSTASFYLERAWIHLRSGNQNGARQDLQWILDHEPQGINIPRVREALESL